MHIFDKCFIGLSAAKEAELNNFESYLASISRDSTDVNQWRSTTLSIIMRSSSDQDKYIDEAAGTVIEKINNIMGDITDVSATQSRDQPLRVLVNSCIELARKLRVQKAKFRTIMPVIEGHQINLFDAQTMEDVGGEDEDTLQGREILCVTFLGILKEGDESGQRLQLRNVIARAKVLCSE
jgi:activating signal cointegrator complex subunit 1